MSLLIADHRSICNTPVDSMTLPQLRAEREQLLDAQVDQEKIQVGHYRLVVEKAISTRLGAITAAITNQTYQKED